jgi:hypothetical protein
MMHSIPDFNKKPQKIVNLGGFAKCSQAKQNNPSLHVFWGDSSSVHDAPQVPYLKEGQVFGVLGGGGGGEEVN